MVSISDRSKGIFLFFTASRWDVLLSVLSNRHQNVSGSKSSRIAKLTSHLHLLMRLITKVLLIALVFVVVSISLAISFILPGWIFKF